jgi:hypothetical protein
MKIVTIGETLNYKFKDEIVRMASLYCIEPPYSISLYDS